MNGQKDRRAYWVVHGTKVLLRTRDIGSARAFQNGLGWPDAKVIAVRVVWSAPLGRSLAYHRRRAEGSSLTALVTAEPESA